MRKFLIALVVMAGMFSMVNAQELSKAIGLRFAYGAEVSYQHPLSDANRVELDLGWAGATTSLHGIYHWVKPISAVNGLNWYVGPGAGLGFYSFAGYSGLSIGVVGQAGLEYSFDFPLQVSVDYRPGVYFITGGAGLTPSYSGFCLAARYKF